MTFFNGKTSAGDGPLTNVLLCATDAGGAKNLIPLLPEVARLGHVTLITRSSFLPLVPPQPSAHRLLFVEDVEGHIESTFTSIAPVAVICGTTRHQSADRDLVRYATRDGVRCVAVVDDWYNYAYRFRAAGQTGPLQLPSAIALPDEQAVSEAVAEGLPAGRCHATGSPALAAIWKLRSLWQTTPPPVPSLLEDARGRPVIVFLSETHALDYGTRPGQSGPMGAYLGYTETSVRDSLLDTLSSLPNEFVFIEKPHPSTQRVDQPARVPANVDYRYATDAMTLELCVHCDAVVGMRSMALLEARLLGCPATSFQPGLIGQELCTAVRLGLVPGLRTREELRAWLQAATTNARPTDTRIQDLGAAPFFARPDAADRIVRLTSGATPS